MTASFNIHETVFYNMEQKGKVFIALADIKKAFDTVVHKGFFLFS